MPHRHPPPARGGPLVVALAVLLLVIAGGVLGAAYYVVLHEEEPTTAAPPAAGLNVPADVIPFDRPVVDEDTGAWVLEFEAQLRWHEPGAVDEVVERARACRDFVRDGRFARVYPEAPAGVRLRIVCAHPLRGGARDRLRAELARIEGIEIELRGLDPEELR